jgi:hypothetical protein
MKIAENQLRKIVRESLQSHGRASGPPPVDDPAVKKYVDDILSITQGLNEGIISRWRALAGIHS